MPKGDWTGWLVLSGRGFGKTRIGAEAVIEKARTGCRYIGLVGETAGDVRNVMIEGESGILAHSRRGFIPHYEPSKRRLTWPNGTIATTYSGDAPGQLRGPQHDFVWADEPAKWQYLTEAWDNLELGLRLGAKPQWVATTTPKPLKLIQEWLADPMVVVTRGNTYANAQNLPKTFIDRIDKKYKGTRLGRQEIYAEILEDTPGALWTMALIDAHRLSSQAFAAVNLTRIVVAIDPAATSGEGSNDTGIIVAGRDTKGDGYLLDDYSVHETPAGWGTAALRAYDEWEADGIIAEVNNGGEMVGHVISSLRKGIPFKSVHASRGKRSRAEPVSTRYEKGEIHHAGMFAQLESEMTTWVPDSGMDSPDRLDAMVWAFTELLISGYTDGRGKLKGV